MKTIGLSGYLLDAQKIAHAWNTPVFGLLEHLNQPWIPHESVHVCGHSWGGLMAIQMAARYPSFVKQLTLFATTPYFLEADAWVGWPATYCRAVRRYVGRDPDGWAQHFQAMAMAPGHAPELKTYFLESPAVEEMIVPLELMALDVRACLATVRCPIRWILGGEDQILPKMDVNALESLNAGIEVIWMEEAGHMDMFAVRHHAWMQEMIHEKSF
jgi:pimeloyl-[acyl-carrier protein] methyl ester esterase